MMKGEHSVQANLLAFMQFNANNVDHNINAVAGKVTFHDLDMHFTVRLFLISSVMPLCSYATGDSTMRVLLVR